MKLHDKVVATKDISTYDPRTFEPNPYILSGSYGRVSEVRERELTNGVRMTAHLLKFDGYDNGVVIIENDGISAPLTSALLDKIQIVND